MGFTKLFSSIITSTIWMEDNPTRIVWVGLLALANANGVIEGSIPGLANVCRVSTDESRRAIEIFLNPDPYSRNADNDGRRIVPHPGGWQILNYKAYRDRGQDKDGSRADYFRRYRENRPRQTPQDQQMETSLYDCNTKNVTCNKLKHNNVACNTEAEAEAEAEADIKNKTLCADFESFWKEYPLRNGSKRGKGKALLEWKKIKPGTILFLKIISSLKSQIENYKDCKLHGEFVAEFPDPERWLKNKRWEDEVKIKSWIERSRETK